MLIILIKIIIKRKCGFFPQHHGHRVIAVATIILYVQPSFPACGFVLVGLKTK